MSSNVSLQKPEEGDVLLTTGLGLTDQGVPVRLPALLIPGLEKLRALKAASRKARYIVYQATDFIIEANKLQANEAQRTAQTMRLYLRRFVQTYYGDVASETEFRMGAACLVREKDLQTVEEGLRSLESAAQSQAPEGALQEAFGLIRAYGARHAEGEVCLRYAAANVLLNGGYEGNYPLVEEQPSKETLVVPLGGKREAPFFALTTAMAHYSGCPYALAPALVETGKMPAYYPCPDGDLLLGQNPEGFKAPRRLRDDFKALAEIGATPEALQALMLPRRPDMRSCLSLQGQEARA